MADRRTNLPKIAGIEFAGIGELDQLNSLVNEIDSRGRQPVDARVATKPAHLFAR